MQHWPGNCTGKPVLLTAEPAAGLTKPVHRFGAKPPLIWFHSLLLWTGGRAGPANHDRGGFSYGAPISEYGESARKQISRATAGVEIGRANLHARAGGIAGRTRRPNHGTEKSQPSPSIGLWGHPRIGQLGIGDVEASAVVIFWFTPLGGVGG